MKLRRRQFLLHLAAGAAALSTALPIAWAQSYPVKPVRWIVGFAPAGGNDIVARLMGQWLTDRLGQSFVIENEPGAATNLAAEAAINAAPDGYTLFLANVSNAINATFYTKLNFDCGPPGEAVSFSATECSTSERAGTQTRKASQPSCPAPTAAYRRQHALQVGRQGGGRKNSSNPDSNRPNVRHSHRPPKATQP